MALLLIGYPLENSKPRKRRSLEEIIIERFISQSPAHLLIAPQKMYSHQYNEIISNIHSQLKILILHIHINNTCIY